MLVWCDGRQRQDVVDRAGFHRRAGHVPTRGGGAILRDDEAAVRLDRLNASVPSLPIPVSTTAIRRPSKAAAAVSSRGLADERRKRMRLPFRCLKRRSAATVKW
jgi:hypothetical protein